MIDRFDIRCCRLFISDAVEIAGRIDPFVSLVEHNPDHGIWIEMSQPYSWRNYSSFVQQL